MRKALLILMVVATALISDAVAQNTGYILVNNNNPEANSASAFKVNAAGTFTPVTTLLTGGAGGTLYYGQPGIAVENQAHCLFVADPETSDIASFQGPSFKRLLPNFTNSQLNGSYAGIGLAVDPAGKFLYTAWTATKNLAVLAIAPDCSLSLVGNPVSQPDVVVDLTLTRNGKVMVVSYPNIGGAQAYKISSEGTLSPIGSELIFKSEIAACASIGCSPTGQDVTDDGVYWVWGSFVTVPSTLTATLTSKGFTNVALQTYPDSALYNVTTPRFSPAAAKTDTGNLYLGALGDYGPFLPAGIIVTAFDKGTITYESEVVNTVAFLAGAVQTIGTQGNGSPLVQSTIDLEGNTTLYSYTVSGTTLTAGDAFLDSAGDDAFSITVFPGRP
jgi:hypothetical protein